MSGLVLDASYILALALKEHDIPDAASVGEILVTQGAHVPTLWRFEVANVLLNAVRRRRITTDQAAACIEDIQALPIVVDAISSEQAWVATYALARQLGLTVYDASYLELAVRMELPLASLDRQLCSAARREGLRVLGA